jgi:hypothetical protein
MADSHGVQTCTGSERPDLVPEVPTLLAARWPRFMLEGHPGHEVDLPALAASCLDLQVLLIDGDQLVGAGIALPLDWDGTVAGLPSGWDNAITRSAAQPSGAAVCALSVTFTAGQDSAAPSVILAAMKQAARQRGARWLVVPVRPVLKTRYPITPMERYLDWRTDDGQPFDPWLRRHLTDGARILATAPVSMTITGTITEWHEWLGMALPDTGDYVIPGGLEPLHVDRDADHAVYREPNVWVCYDL